MSERSEDKSIRAYRMVQALVVCGFVVLAIIIAVPGARSLHSSGPTLQTPIASGNPHAWIDEALMDASRPPVLRTVVERSCRYRGSVWDVITATVELEATEVAARLQARLGGDFEAQELESLTSMVSDAFAEPNGGADSGAGTRLGTLEFAGVFKQDPVHVLSRELLGSLGALPPTPSDILFVSVYDSEPDTSTLFMMKPRSLESLMALSAPPDPAIQRRAIADWVQLPAEAEPMDMIENELPGRRLTTHWVRNGIGVEAAIATYAAVLSPDRMNVIVVSGGALQRVKHPKGELHLFHMGLAGADESTTILKMIEDLPLH